MTIKTDITELRRFIRLPGEVKSSAWQTGTFAPNGEDWWLAAILDVGDAELAAFLHAPETTELFETPPGLKLESAFAALRTLPGAEITDAQGGQTHHENLERRALCEQSTVERRRDQDV